MPQIETMLTVAAAGFALSATPGPSMLYVLSRSVGQSRAAGLASAVGLAIGGTLLAVATALGLATLFARFEWLVPVLSYIGSAYLLWLGLGMIRDGFKQTSFALEAERVTQKPLSSIIWQGVLVELLNPKTVLFFALFLPPFVSAEADQLGGAGMQLQLLILGVLVPLTALPTDIVVAFMGGTITRAVSRQKFIKQSLAVLGGLTLIGIVVSLQVKFF